MTVRKPARPAAPAAEAPALPDVRMEWGSDVAAACLRALGQRYVALVPGASFRGLHDSLVNYLGARDPALVVCLHEEHAVAIADGYARVTEQPMAVALHANVGLMHAAMAIFNAWCDRSPMLILGATGPLDAHQRRPWIDWVHTARDQGALVRPYVKWDDQPASPQAIVESILRAAQIARTAPHGPVYVCLDAALQEQRLAEAVAIPPVARFQPPSPPAVPAETVERILAALRGARRPVLLMGRGSRRPADWEARVRLAEAVGGLVLTSVHNASVFPTEHPLHALPVCGERMAEAEREALACADVIVSLDWLDLAGFLRAAGGHAQTQQPVAATVIHASLDATLANGWSMEHQALPAVDIPVLATGDQLAAQLLAAGDGPLRAEAAAGPGLPHWSASLPEAAPGSGPMTLDDLARTVSAFARAQDATLARTPIGWPRTANRFTGPLSYLGKDGGAAVGVGPGNTVGAALALRGSGRLVLGVLGDGDFLMGVNALWSASHLELPLLLVIANNRAYYNDVVHQERMARERGRPVERKWIGQRLDAPPLDLLALARAQGFAGEGPVTRVDALEAALQRGAAAVAAGGRCVIDAHIEPGYAAT